MENVIVKAFFDELEKIAFNISSTETKMPTKPGEVKPPITPKQIQAKAVNPRKMKGTNTNYTRSNIEVPGTDVTIAAGQKTSMPPPVRV
jgi:hypothetical protein